MIWDLTLVYVLWALHGSLALFLGGRPSPPQATADREWKLWLQ